MAKVSLTTLWNDFYAWIARKDNPHQVTASQAGAYAKAEIESLLTGYVPSGVLPISTFGDSGAVEGGVSAGSRLESITFTLSDGAMTLLLQGRQYRFKTNKFNFTCPVNTTLYIYVNRDPSLGTESAYLEALTAPRADTPTSFFVAGIKRGGESDNTVLTARLAYICLIDVYRISTEPVGSAIPASSGMSTETGTFKW